jgi:hypothetical protein
MQPVNPLICYLQAKDIPDVLNPLKEIPCDKLYIKYYAYPHPHRIARDFFLEHEEYTHLIIHPPDLIVKAPHFFLLKNDLEYHDFLEVLGGVCNVDMGENIDKWNICFNLPSLGIHKRVYQWVKKRRFDPSIIRVRHCGNSFMFVSRAVVENLKDESGRPGLDGTDLYDKDGFAPDLFFCTSCYKSNIPIYVDTEVQMVHLRFEGDMLVGKREPQTLYVKWNQEPIDVTKEQVPFVRQGL